MSGISNKTDFQVDLKSSILILHSKNKPLIREQQTSNIQKKKKKNEREINDKTEWSIEEDVSTLKNNISTHCNAIITLLRSYAV